LALRGACCRWWWLGWVRTGSAWPPPPWSCPVCTTIQKKVQKLGRGCRWRHLDTSMKGGPVSWGTEAFVCTVAANNFYDVGERGRLPWMVPGPSCQKNAPKIWNIPNLSPWYVAMT
jgi:hypothetical protein